MIKERHIDVIGNAKVIKISKDGVTYLLEVKEEKIECDTVIIAAGYNSNNRLEDELEGKVTELTVIGDAESPRKILTAIHEGYHVIRVM